MGVSRAEDENHSTLRAPSSTLYRELGNLSDNVEPASSFEKWVIS